LSVLRVDWSAKPYASKVKVGILLLSEIYNIDTTGLVRFALLSNTRKSSQTWPISSILLCFLWQSVASLPELLLKLRCILWDLFFTLTKHTHHSRCTELKLKFKFCFCLFLLTNRWHIRILLYSEVSRQRIWSIELLIETFPLKYFQCSGLRSSFCVICARMRCSH
jgi:hypothetical protein